MKTAHTGLKEKKAPLQHPEHRSTVPAACETLHVAGDTGVKFNPIR